jgi:chromosome segregation ATPase
MSQIACGYSLSGLWKMNKKQSIPMLFAALQEVGDLQRQIKELKLERQRDTIAEVRSARDRAISENEKLKEIIDKLQKENKEYEFESCESVVKSQKVYEQAFAIQAERDKLQEENKKLKEQVEYCEGVMEGDEDLEERLKAQHQIDISSLKEENEKLKEEVDGWKSSRDDDIREARGEAEEEKDAHWNDWLNKEFGDELYPISPSPEPDEFVKKVKELKEQNIEKCQAHITTLEIDLLKTKKIYALEEENEELKEENKKLKAKFQKFKEVLTQE